VFRQHRAGLIALVLSTTVVSTAIAGDNIVDPLVSRFSLANGLSVLLAPDARSSVVGLQLRYRVGSRDDPETRPGLTGLVQKLMMRRTLHVAEGQYDRLLDEAGGYDSQASTGNDKTIFAVSVPSDRLALPLWLWSDQMGYFAASIDDRLIQQQLAVMRNERAQRIDNAPAGRTADFAHSALYPVGHPYRAGPLPAELALPGLTAADVRAFVEARYAPDNAVLILTGDFDPGKARTLIEKYFAPLLRKNPPPRRAGERPSLTGETRLQVAAQVELPSVSITWSTPAWGAPGDAELDIIAELLTGERAGLLRWKLVDSLKVASSVWAGQASRALGSRFVIMASATRGHTPGELVAAIDQVLASLQAQGPAPYEMRASVVGHLIGQLFSLEQSNRRAERYADCEEQMISQPCFRTWLARYTSIDGAALSAVAARELPLQRRIVVEVTPTPGAPIAGELRPSSGGSPR
jgi:zinc protease